MSEPPETGPVSPNARAAKPEAGKEAPAARTAESIEDRIAAAAARRAASAAVPGAAAGAAPAAAAPRPAARPLNAGRVPASAASHMAEISTVLEQVRKSAQAVDEGRVRRSYRNWVNWLAGRGRAAPLCIAVLPGERWDQFAAELGIAGVMSDEAAFELYRTSSSLRLDRPWPRLPCAVVPEGISLLVINDPEAFAREWDMVAALRRDCVLALAFPGTFEDVPAGMLDRLAIGAVRLAWTGTPVPTANPALHLYGASLARDCGIVAALARLVPVNLREAMRAAVIANDLAAIGSALQAEDEKGSAAAGILAASEGARVRRSETERLSMELEQLVGARNDFAAEVKGILNSLRQQRGEIESGTLVEQSTSVAFESLIGRFDPSSDESLDNLIHTRPKRTWWEGTRFELFSWFFSKKSEAQLDDSVLNASLADVERTSLRWLGKVTVDHVSEFNRAIDSVGLSYFGGNSPLSAHLAEKVYLDNFVVGAKPPPGGAAPQSSLAQKMVQSAQAAFKSFAAGEVRAFRIERERRGFVGQITEARSAIFGIYFLLLMGVRLVPPMECVTPETVQGTNEAMTRADPAKLAGLQTELADQQAALAHWTNDFACWANKSLNYDLRVTLMALILAGLLVNIFSHPRQERAMLADRVQTKLDELRSRLIAFLDRFLKDQLAVLETTLVDQAALIDSALERRRATTQAKLDLLRSAATPARTDRTTPMRVVQLDDITRKLAAKVRGDFQAEYSAALADA